MDLSKVNKGDRVYILYPATTPKLVTVDAVWEHGINYTVNGIKKCVSKAYLYEANDYDGIVEELENLIADCEHSLKIFKEEFEEASNESKTR